ncbi:MAG: hypothetical protein WB950_16935, partial [Acidobacteriaceae bacterium]
VGTDAENLIVEPPHLNVNIFGLDGDLSKLFQLIHHPVDFCYIDIVFATGYFPNAFSYLLC